MKVKYADGDRVQMRHDPTRFGEVVRFDKMGDQVRTGVPFYIVRFDGEDADSCVEEPLLCREGDDLLYDALYALARRTSMIQARLPDFRGTLGYGRVRPRIRDERKPPGKKYRTIVLGDLDRLEIKGANGRYRPARDVLTEQGSEGG